MKLFKNKYRIASARAQWWDYGWNGAYFITICTKNRKHFFGEIADGKMNLSPLGVIADVFWHEIPHHAEHVKLGEFVVMPNHIHGILILDKPIVDQGHALDPRGKPNPVQIDFKTLVKTPFRPFLDHINLPLQNTLTAWN